MASDNRRHKIKKLMKHISSSFQASEHTKVLQLVDCLLRQLEKEGIATPNLMYDSEFRAYLACKHTGRHDEARVWLEKAHQHVVMVYGAKSKLAHNWGNMLNPKPPQVRRY